MARRNIAMLVVAAAAGLAGCTRPPPEAYVRAASSALAPQVSIGKDVADETCTQPADAATGFQPVQIYCGTSQRAGAISLLPAATVRRYRPIAAADLAQAAQTSPWRATLDGRLQCNTPESTTILGGQPAMVMKCTVIGGESAVALLTTIRGVTYGADAVSPARSIMVHSIGVLSGLEQPADAGAAFNQDTLNALRLAEASYSIADFNDYEGLIESGTQANLEQNFAAAEADFRAAVALKTKLLNSFDDPDNVTPTTYLALAISDQRRFDEADKLFAKALSLVGSKANGKLAPTDRNAVPRLLHYRGLHALNQGKYDVALDLLQTAQRSYEDSLTGEGAVLAAHPRVQLARSNRLADLLPSQFVYANPTTQSALLGLVEVHRYKGVVLRAQGRYPESQAEIAAADALAASYNLDQPGVDARLFRTQAMVADARGQTGAEISGLDRSSSDFARAWGDTQPLAETELLDAAALHHAQRDADALVRCRNAVHLLLDLHAGISATLIAPCLDVMAGTAAAQPKQGQAMLAEMFAAAQLAQGGITSSQIADAAARQLETAKDPKFGALQRARQETDAKINELNRQRDALDPAAPDAKQQAAELEKQITAAHAALETQQRQLLSDPETAREAENYSQLIQDVVPASAVFAALTPGESLVTITLADHEGWVFLLRDGRITLAHCRDGADEMGELVGRLRASLVPIDQLRLPPFDIADAQRIYTDLFATLEPELADAKAMVVAPFGPLLSLPFGVLLTGPADPANLAAAPFLLRKLVIAHVPAATSFVQLRQAGQTGAPDRRPWIGFGDFQPIRLRAAPDATGCQGSTAQALANAQPLPGTRKELDAAREVLQAPAADEVLGPAFTAAAVQHIPLKQYRILHFAAHAVLPNELGCQAEPAIITSAPSGASDASAALLTATDIGRLELDADLVILSACNSGGAGGTTAGESLSGLARAFLFAGARAVVVSHWNLSDQTGPLLVKLMLKRLHDTPEVGVAAALRGAEIELMDYAVNHHRTDIMHPFFWAPLAAIGEDGRGGATRSASADRAAVPAGL